MCPVFRGDDRDGSLRKADRLSAAPAETFWPIRQACAGAYASIAEFDDRRWFGWHRDRREIRLAKDATRSLRKCRSPFPLIQIDGPLGSDACTRSIAGTAQNHRQR